MQRARRVAAAYGCALALAALITEDPVLLVALLAAVLAAAVGAGVGPEILRAAAAGRRSRSCC